MEWGGGVANFDPEDGLFDMKCSNMFVSNLFNTQNRGNQSKWQIFSDGILCSNMHYEGKFYADYQDLY